MSSEATYSVTVKVNGDLFTVRGDNADEFAEHLRAAVTGNLVTYVEALQEVARNAAANPPLPAAVVQAFPGAQIISDTNQYQPAPQAQPAPTPQQAQVQAAAQGAAPACEHGARVWREGVSKSSGKPYRGWFCPSMDRGNQCKPMFGAV